MTSDNARPRYSMIIQWSNEVDAFLVALPEWKSRVINTYVTHGETYEEAVKNGREVLEMLVEDALECGEELPAPHVLVTAG